MPISICLLNYNSYPDTIECIDSLLKQTVSDFDIIVVDNCSTNNSVQIISGYLSDKEIPYSSYTHKNSQFTQTTPKSNQKPKVYLISNDANNGFSSGNNIAIRFSNSYLQNSRLLLLNNDTVVEPDFIRLMSEEYEKLQKTHQAPIAMGATENSYYSRKETHTGFHYLHLLSGLALSKPVFPCFKYICGACLMIDNQVPIMDESYFLYFEDAEFSKRLLANGYVLCTTKKARYFHKVSSSMTDSSVMIQHQFKSMWKFYRQHYRSFIPFVFLTRFLEYLLMFRFKTAMLLCTTLKNK